MGEPWFEPQQGQKIFLLYEAFIPPLGPTKSSSHWLIGVISSGSKRPGREVYHSPLTSTKVKNEWSYTSTPPLCLYCVDSDTLIFLLFITDV